MIGYLDIDFMSDDLKLVHSLNNPLINMKSKIQMKRFYKGKGKSGYLVCQTMYYSEIKKNSDTRILDEMLEETLDDT